MLRFAIVVMVSLGSVVRLLMLMRGRDVLMVRGTQRQIDVVEELMHALLPPGVLGQVGNHPDVAPSIP